MNFREFLLERRWHELKDGNIVYLNPTIDEFHFCAGKHSTVRGFLDPKGNVFIWPTWSYGLHIDVAKEIHERISVPFYVNYEREGWIVEPAEMSLSRSLIGYNVPRAVEMLDDNPNIKRMLGL